MSDNHDIEPTKWSLEQEDILLRSLILGSPSKIQRENRAQNIVDDSWTLKLNITTPIDIGPFEDEDEPMVISEPILCKCGQDAITYAFGSDCFQGFCSSCAFGPSLENLEYGSSVKVGFAQS